jgi:hypothetical protein
MMKVIILIQDVNRNKIVILIFEVIYKTIIMRNGCNKLAA